ncbi:hypothetical protein BRC78_08650 [Halobacteriales archaeon QH_8_68_33]|nr:MAG: hypothetical protein BRC78_08650 [Halobacteriales archaeon QH_8_68_33]
MDGRLDALSERERWHVRALLGGPAGRGRRDGCETMPGPLRERVRLDLEGAGVDPEIEGRGV